MDNPLNEIITDSQYALLAGRGYLNIVKIEKDDIKKRYKELRAKGIKPDSAIELINSEYQHLAFETVRHYVMNNKK
jgi:hypothetical protein